VSSANPSDDLRARLKAHGYHLFLTPGRPSGWWVTIRDGRPGIEAPVESFAETRDEAMQLADRLFTSHRLAELDRLIRDRGQTPPPWTEPDQHARLETLAAYARTLTVA
jgi:hypothetical protein